MRGLWSSINDDGGVVAWGVGAISGSTIDCHDGCDGALGLGELSLLIPPSPQMAPKTERF